MSHIPVELTIRGVAEEQVGWLTSVLLEAVRGGAEWVLWVLAVLSLLSVAVMIERARFYIRHRVDAHALRNHLIGWLDRGEVDEALSELQSGNRSMESNVLAYGFQNRDRGPRAVEELMAGALARERSRYERFLAFLGTLGNNAPFIGLFGTVLGVINAFDGLRGLDVSDTEAAGAAVMGPIAEALIATAVGLLVAIPAVVAFNIFRSRVKRSTSNTELLARTLVAYLATETKEDER